MIKLFGKNNDLRTEKTSKAYSIIKKNHTWENRAMQIAKFLE